MTSNDRQFEEFFATDFTESCQMILVLKKRTFHPLCNPEGILCYPYRLSRWLCYWQYLIRMIYGQRTMSSGWLTVLPWIIRIALRKLNPKSPGWLSYWQYLFQMTYGQCTMSSGWLKCYPKSSGWVSSWLYLIRINHGQCRRSSGLPTMLPYITQMT